MRRGTAKLWDHAQLVHGQWLHIVKNHMQIFVKRVRSEDNVADPPSRGVSYVAE